MKNLYIQRLPERIHSSLTRQNTSILLVEPLECRRSTGWKPDTQFIDTATDGSQKVCSFSLLHSIHRRLLQTNGPFLNEDRGQAEYRTSVLKLQCTFKFDKCFSFVRMKRWLLVSAVSCSTRVRHTTATNQPDVFIRLFWKWSRIAASASGVNSPLGFDSRGRRDYSRFRLTTCFGTQFFFNSTSECLLPILVLVVKLVTLIYLVSSSPPISYSSVEFSTISIVCQSCSTGKNELNSMRFFFRCSFFLSI